MCEIYVRTEPRFNADPYLDVKCYKRGDVVTIQEDGWKWGSAELNNGAHSIIAVPGVAAAKMVALLTPELGDPLVNKMLQRRGFKFDIDSYEAAQKLAGAKPLDETAALSLVSIKPALVDPDIIGV